MRRITVSVLSMLFALPAIADARLPVVNIAAGSVSARAAFGDVPAAPVATSTASADVGGAVEYAPMPKDATRTAKKIVSRPTAPKATVAKATPAAPADVLSPNRPSADLWAKNDVPLRMPDPSEFSVLSANYDLPEESLNSSAAAARVAANVAPASYTAPVAPSAAPLSEMDAQIARLVELQRKADESARVAAAQPSVAQSVAQVREPAYNINPVPVESVTNDSLFAAWNAERDIAPREEVLTRDDDVHLSRLVVPMAPEVVVRTVEKNTSPRIAAVRDDMTKMSPTELRKAFRKTFLSENKHLSTFQIDDRFDVSSDMSRGIEGFTAHRDLSEEGGIRPLEIKIKFRNEDSALSRENYNLLSEYASIVVSNPKRAIQIALPQSVASNMDARKLAARRLAIVEQVLRDTGVAEQRIMPVLAQREDDAFVLRIISNDQFETLTQKQRNMFGDTVSNKTYKSMSW